MELEVRERLAQYLDGKITLEEFEAWFLSETWDTEQDGDARLISSVRHRLGEFSSGDWTEGELRVLLRPLIGTYMVFLGSPRLQTQQISFGATQAARPFQFSGVGRSLAGTSS